MFFVIAIPILGVACIVIYKANKYPDKVPEVFGIKPMIVLSGSMETSIHTGDVVFVKIVDTDTLENGDVIAFRNESNKVTTRRIVETVRENGQQYFKTTGDANDSENPDLIKMSDVEGVYIGRISGLGIFFIFIQKPIGLIWLYLVNKIDEKNLLQKKNKKEKNLKNIKKEKRARTRAEQIIFINIVITSTKYLL